MMIELTSELTCPHCGHRAVEEMPTDACQFFYDCEGCGCLLRPKPGDCCVFCSYGVGALSAGPAGQILPLRMPRRAPRR